MKEVKTIVTHNGPFHADDVFAVALLKTLYPESKVIRTRDPEVIATGDIVLDVGGMYDPKIYRFDHHQENGAGKRDNGIDLSAIGLIWREYGLEFCDGNEEVAKKIEEGFVAALDADDNGQNLYSLTDYDVSPMTLPEVISLYRPTTHEDEDFDAAFNRACEWAGFILQRIKKKRLNSWTDKQEFRKKLESSPDKRYLILDKFIVGGDVYDDYPELLYTVFPSVNGDWTIRAVSKGKETFTNRKDLPSAWSGLEKSALAGVTGVEDAVFCHRGLWICGAESKEGALRLLELAMAN